MIFHIPHSSRLVPYQVRGQFVLSDKELELELTRMTDAYTDEIFSMAGATVVKFPVSRLVVDVERFEDDADEPMSKVGMGKITVKTSHGARLRRELEADEVKKLITEYYRPHHLLLQAAVESELGKRGRALIVDCHSFPSRPLPCDKDQTGPRLDACLGKDPFHTPQELVELALAGLVTDAGFSVGLDWPYSGTIMPLAFYGKDPRVSSIMIEINRRLYLDEGTGKKNEMFVEIKAKIIRVLLKIEEFDKSGS